MFRRLVSPIVVALVSSLAVPALAASKDAPAKSVTAKKPAKKVLKADRPGPSATQHRADPKGRTFIKTQRAGWQEVVVGHKVVATRADGSKVTGTIREVSELAIVIEPPQSRRVTIASNDLAQVFAAH